MKLPKHLYKHPQGCFYFVLNIPKPLQASFEGFPRLRYSLNTKSPLEAKAEAYKHTAYWLTQFEKVQMTKEPKVEDILKGKIWQKIVATKTGFISQAKTREERELDLEEIGRLEEKGVSPESLMEVQKPTVRVVPAQDHFAPKEKITLQEAYKIYLDDIASIKNKKTKQAKDKAVFELKQFLNPKTRLFTVTKKDLQDFKHYLLNEVENDINTVHYKFNYITQFFEIMRNGSYYLLENPARGQVPYSKAQKNKKAQSSRHLAFDEEEIKTIFSLENFSRIKQPHTFWGSLIALHTGMRASEIGQLRTIDVSKSKMTIKIAVSNDHQSLKTIYSTRTLPIHPKLVEIGLFEYMEDIAVFKQWQLFPNLNKTINGYGTRMSNDFSRYLVDIGAKQKRKSLHSFRSNVNQAISDNKVNKNCQERFLGHEVEGINYTHYDREITVERLREECIPVINFDIDKRIKYQRNMFNDFITNILLKKKPLP